MTLRGPTQQRGFARRRHAQAPSRGRLAHGSVKVVGLAASRAGMCPITRVLAPLRQSGQTDMATSVPPAARRGSGPTRQVSPRCRKWSSAKPSPCICCGPVRRMPTGGPLLHGEGPTRGPSRRAGRRPSRIYLDRGTALTPCGRSVPGKPLTVADVAQNRLTDRYQ